jgi:hypothetical protein
MTRKILSKMSTGATNPVEYLALQRGWRKKLVEALRFTVRASAKFDETIKYGHLVYFSNGPVLFIRAEESRVLFGFWRGKRLRTLEPRLKTGGKYELATLELTEGTAVSLAVVRKLAREAAALNKRLGDPTHVIRK